MVIFEIVRENYKSIFSADFEIEVSNDADSERYFQLKVREGVDQTVNYYLVDSIKDIEYLCKARKVTLKKCYEEHNRNIYKIVKNDSKDLESYVRENLVLPINCINSLEESEKLIKSVTSLIKEYLGEA